MGLDSLLKEMIGEEKMKDGSDSENESQEMADTISEVNTNQKDSPSNKDDLNFGAKSPSAEDYFDINELAEDDNPVVIKDEYDADDEAPKNDQMLMPPPPPKDLSEYSSKCEEMEKKKLETPLAAMLPSKYANVDVTELFPDFRHGKVLRFSRLFGPGKPSSLPNIWRNVRKKRKKRKHKDTANHMDSDSNSEEEKPRNRGWFIDYAPEPPPEQIVCDDEVKFLNPLEAQTVDNKPETEKKTNLAQKRPIGVSVQHKSGMICLMCQNLVMDLIMALKQRNSKKRPLNKKRK